MQSHLPGNGGSLDFCDFLEIHVGYDRGDSGHKVVQSENRKHRHVDIRWAIGEFVIQGLVLRPQELMSSVRAFRFCTGTTGKRNQGGSLLGDFGQRPVWRALL